MIIGLTGGSGTGKSSVSKVFKEHGFEVIDFDIISREVSMPGTKCHDEIILFFGKEIMNSDTTINRKKLGEIVFADRKKLDILTKITHKHILIRTQEIIESSDGKNLLFDAPLLFEAKLNEKCDFVISVLADKEKRIERIVSRDGISEETAINRINSQHNDDFYVSQSDYSIYNNSTQEELEKEAGKIIRSIFNETIRA